MPRNAPRSYAKPHRKPSDSHKTNGQHNKPQDKTAGKPDRKAQRRALLEDAAKVRLPHRCNVCVIGGGAAGLVAGISAAEAGANVVVLERSVEAGRSILATGNGRCNFCNADLAPSHYNHPDFVAQACGPNHLQDVLDFFAQSGLAWVSEEDRLYPRSRQASSVRNVLLGRAHRAGVTFANARKVQTIERIYDGLRIRLQEDFGDYRQQTIQADTVVFAIGGPRDQLASADGVTDVAKESASAKGGPTDLIASLGIQTVAAQPVLCPLACSSTPLFKLDGRRAHCTARLMCDGNEIAVEKGEVLFRSYGLSGIAIFNLSRLARRGDVISLDLLDDLTQRQALECVQKAEGDFAGILDPQIAQVVAEVAQKSTRSSSQRLAPARVVALAKDLRLSVLGPADQKHAQVTRGGLACDEFDPSTLQSHNAPGFFACGEALDVDGDCGGYNLAWAWKSGMVAGTAAANQALGKE